jgi:hypothetical protein
VPKDVCNGGTDVSFEHRIDFPSEHGAGSVYGGISPNVGRSIDSRSEGPVAFSEDIIIVGLLFRGFELGDG